MEGTGELCIVCCYSFKPSHINNEGGENRLGGVSGGIVEENSKLFRRFCKELADIQRQQRGGGGGIGGRSQFGRVRGVKLEGEKKSLEHVDCGGGGDDGEDEAGEMLKYLTGGGERGILELEASEEVGGTGEVKGVEGQEQSFGVSRSPRSPTTSPPVCPDCLRIMSEVTSKRGSVEGAEAQVSKLQLEVISQLKELQGKLGEYFLEMGRMEEVVKNSDVSCLEAYLEGGGGEGFSEGRKAAVVSFRNWILSASTEVQSFQNVLKRKLLMTPTPGPLSSRSRRSSLGVVDPDPPEGIHSLRKRAKPKPKKCVPAHIPGPSSFNPLDFLSLEVAGAKPPGTDPASPPPVVKTEKDLEGYEDHAEGAVGDPAAQDDDDPGDFAHMAVTEDEDYDYYPASARSGSSSSGTEDDTADSDYCPSGGEQEEAMIEQQHFLARLSELPADVDPLQPAPILALPPLLPKKKKKKWKKKRKTRDVSDQVLGMTEFKGDTIKRIIKMQDRKAALRAKQLAKEPNRPPDYLVEDPSQDYDIQVDFSTGTLTLGHVEILLDEDTESLMCSECLYSTNKLADSSYRYKQSEKIMHIFYHILGKHLEAFKCAVCEAVLQTRCRYKDHIKGHQMQFACEFCGKCLSSKGSLNVHKWRLHMSEKDIQEALARGETDPRLRHQRFLEKQAACVFQCATCGKDFKTSTQLKTHQETHIDVNQRKQFICPQCGKSFTKGGWISHQANTCRPEGTPMLDCEHCPPESRKSFASKALLKRHTDRCHSVKGLERPHQCNTCGKGFKTIAELKRHDASHSDARPYSCKYGCGACFKHTKHCRRHEGTCKGVESSWRGPRQSRGEKPERPPPQQVRLPDPLEMSNY